MGDLGDDPGGGLDPRLRLLQVRLVEAPARPHARIKAELGVALAYPTYREGLAALKDEGAPAGA
jgi:hypothetical protein